MAISHVSPGDSGAATRSKLNEAIDKANLVDGKADQSAIAAETSARSAAINIEEYCCSSSLFTRTMLDSNDLQQEIRL